MLARSLIIFLGLLLCVNSFAYKPEVGHDHLLPMAYELLKACDSASVVNLTDADIDIARKASAGMDTGSVNIEPKPTPNPFSFSSRLLHWHFYNTKKPYGEKLWFFSKDYSKVWEWLNQGYSDSSSKEHKLTYLGGIAHFIEDMANPAHVIPVFHMLGIEDGIDSFKPEYNKLNNNIKSKRYCKRLLTYNKQSSPTDIRNQLTNITLGLLDTSIPQCNDFTWGDFFVPPKENEYFGSFVKTPIIQSGKITGPKKQLKSFYIGSKGVLKIGSRQCPFLDNDHRYQDFINQLFINAIIADAALLSWHIRSQ